MTATPNEGLPESRTAIDHLALNGTPRDPYVAMDVGDGMTYPVISPGADVQHRTIFLPQ